MILQSRCSSADLPGGGGLYTTQTAIAERGLGRRVERIHNQRHL
jgi:hypothetical protein